ncbi:protein PHYTOCHROME KINASE SUBSTRATE 1 [Coffea eugenioides]|uniref:protein PHYTOCHROME KINASE SUBSTRATE 1 n=1 Tax=Coffea eugenioides TaxID=49369 RepID=UPI000F6081CC|nr:protein PHYTOCHROME KINASE SUBSTRATE 1 [Coffea eugenioides]
MAMLTLDTASETNIPRTVPFRNSSNLRDASFSSYLNGSEETFVHQLADSSKSCEPLISTPLDHLHLVSKKAEDTEIDIFSADKYFNEGVEEETPRIAHKYSPKLDQKMDPPPELDPLKQQTRSGTPSIRSESSWNSQNALLQNIPRNQLPRKTNKANRRSFLANIACNCSCSDKNSVDIDIPLGENNCNMSANGKQAYGKAGKPTKAVDLVSLSESQSSTLIREDSPCRKFDQLGIGLSTNGHFRFPASHPTTEDNPLEMQRKKEEDDTRRISLEVFGSPTERKGKMSSSLERSLNMLTWDAIVPKVDEIEVQASSRGMYNDTDSDASSDLFEIESFSTNPSQYLTRQASNNSMTQTTCYAPSEASIEWSVATASAADFSVMSDTEELRSTTTKANPRGNGMALNGRSTPVREMPKRRSGILSGCYSQKAVRVAGDVYRTGENTCPGRHQKTEFLMPMTRFHAENEVARFDKRNDHFGQDTRLFTCSQSRRPTELLYKH